MKFAVINNGIVSNVIKLNDIADAHPEMTELVEVTSQEAHIGLGYSVATGFEQPVKTLLEKTNKERSWRNSQYRMIRDELEKIEDGHPSGRSTLVLWRQYRNELRDYEQQVDFPNGTRPISPGGA